MANRKISYTERDFEGLRARPYKLYKTVLSGPH